MIASMKTIAVHLADADADLPRPAVEIDGTRVAAGLGLEVDAFRRLMEHGRVSALCERGTGDDAGLWRATFYHGRRRFRAVVDGDGRILHVDPSVP